jgi:hypothetical protein
MPVREPRETEEVAVSPIKKVQSPFAREEPEEAVRPVEQPLERDVPAIDREEWEIVKEEPSRPTTVPD